MVNINIAIPDELHKQLRMQAVLEDKTLKQLVIERIDKGVEK